MARISDKIANFIYTLIDENEKDETIIQRNDLADKFNCAPSQINYVLTTRFTNEKGYLIESRRGGGGYIIIRRVNHRDNMERINIINNAIGYSITYQGAISILDYLLEGKNISLNEYEIIKVSLNDRTLAAVEDKNRVRADILKGIIVVILSQD